MSEQSKLLSVTEYEYGDLYKSHILEQYKLYVEMMDRVSQRRLSTNTFFITANSTLLTLFSIIKPVVNNSSFLFSVVGVIICVSWYYMINSYRQLNTGKFHVINELEEYLPLSLYDYEWNILEQGQNREKYWPLSYIECYVPFSFAVIYIVLIFIG